MLWIDGVGGYLVCLGDEVVLGQAIPGSRVDVPILADLSSHHAMIRREGDGYVVSPAARVESADLRIDTPAPLFDGQTLRLGDSVDVQFRQPHPLSASARLNIVSRHRTQPSTDAVLMMRAGVEPLRRSISSRVRRKYPMWLTPKVVSKPSSVMVCFCMITPALLKRTWRGRSVAR